MASCHKKEAVDKEMCEKAVSKLHKQISTFHDCLKSSTIIKKMSENQTNTKSIEKFLTELDVRIRARYPLIAVNTYEEDRVRNTLIDLVFRERHKEKPLYFWSRPTGLQKVVDPKDGVLKNPAVVGDTEEPESVLSFIAEQDTGIFLLCDYAPFITHLRTGRGCVGQTFAGNCLAAEINEGDGYFCRTELSRFEDA